MAWWSRKQDNDTETWLRAQLASCHPPSPSRPTACDDLLAAYKALIGKQSPLFGMFPVPVLESGLAVSVREEIVAILQSWEEHFFEREDRDGLEALAQASNGVGLPLTVRTLPERVAPSLPEIKLSEFQSLAVSRFAETVADPNRLAATWEQLRLGEVVEEWMTFRVHLGPPDQQQLEMVAHAVREQGETVPEDYLGFLCRFDGVEVGYQDPEHVPHSVSHGIYDSLLSSRHLSSKHNKLDDVVELPEKLVGQWGLAIGESLEGPLVLALPSQGVWQLCEEAPPLFIAVSFSAFLELWVKNHLSLSSVARARRDEVMANAVKECVEEGRSTKKVAKECGLNADELKRIVKAEKSRKASAV